MGMCADGWCCGWIGDGVVHKMTDKQWDTILALHTKAPFWMVRAAAKYFRVRDSEDRSIINISSTSGLHGNACASPFLPYSPRYMLKLTLTKPFPRIEARPTMP